MSNESVVVIILRLAGFYIGVTTLWLMLRIAVSFPVASNTGATMIVGAWGVGSLIVLAVAFFLIGFPRLVTRKLLARKEAEETAAPWSLDDFQAVLFAVLGLFFITEAAVKLFSFAVSLVVWLADGRPPFESVGDLLGEALRLGVGVWLLFGARGLRSLIRAARRAGQRIQ